MNIEDIKKAMAYLERNPTYLREVLGNASKEDNGQPRLAVRDENRSVGTTMVNTQSQDTEGSFEHLDRNVNKVKISHAVENSDENQNAHADENVGQNAYVDENVGQNAYADENVGQNAYVVDDVDENHNSLAATEVDEEHREQDAAEHTDRSVVVHNSRNSAVENGVNVAVNDDVAMRINGQINPDYLLKLENEMDFDDYDGSNQSFEQITSGDDDDGVDDSLFNNDTGRYRSKETFLDMLSDASKKLNLEYVITEDYIGNLDTERSMGGIWVFEPNQRNFYNPSGKGVVNNDPTKTTIFYCKVCRSFYDKLCNRRKKTGCQDGEPIDFYKTSCIQIQGSKVVRPASRHHPQCNPETLQENLGNLGKTKTNKLAGNGVTLPHASYTTVSDKLSKICAEMDWEIGVAKTRLGPYSGKIGASARMRRYLSLPKVDKATMEFPYELRFANPIDDTSEYEPFHVYGKANSEIIVFASDTLLRLYANSDIRMGNGTFWIRPEGFCQIYTLIVVVTEEKNGEYRRKYVPVAFAIMKERKCEAYKQLFKILKKRMHQLKIDESTPKVFLTDNEKAIIKIIDEIYPGKHKLCYFHMCQSFTKMLKKCGLIKILLNVRRDNTDVALKAKAFYEFFRKVICIPMLPQQLMKTKWSDLKNEIKTNWRSYLTEESHLNRLKNFLGYVDKWFGERVGERDLERICKWRETIRTTNACEAYHKLLRNSPYARKRGTVSGNAMLIKCFDEQSRLALYKINNFNDSNNFAIEPLNKKCLEREQLIKMYQDQLEESNFENVDSYMLNIINLMMPRQLRESVNHTLEQLEYLEVPNDREPAVNNEEVRNILAVDDHKIHQDVSEEHLNNALVDAVMLDFINIGMPTEIGRTTRSGRKIVPNSRYFNHNLVNY